jgi:hypothetical protein
MDRFARNDGEVADHLTPLPQFTGKTSRKSAFPAAFS